MKKFKKKWEIKTEKTIVEKIVDPFRAYLNLTMPT
jgi:hypothetical protein